MGLNSIKRTAARLFDLVGINSLGYFAQRAALFPFIRVVNYHGIPAELADAFEQHLLFYKTRFADVSREDLELFLRDGIWRHDKPGLIISFDDGLRSHFEVAAPILEKHGFTGWFFVPSGWVIEDLSAPVPDFVAEESLTLEQLRYLDQHHVVGCHTETHRRLSADLPADIVRMETEGARETLAAKLGHEVDIFCWVGGEEYTYSKAASDLINKTFRFGFMTNNAPLRPGTNPMQIQRTNIEAENPLSLVRFQIAGFMDLAYLPKRRRVNRLTA